MRRVADCSTCTENCRLVEGREADFSEWTHKGGENGESLVISDVAPTLQGERVMARIESMQFA